MRVAVAVIVWTLASVGCAAAAPVPLAWDGIWTTFGDVASEQKVCAVQADVGGGNFALFARSDEPRTLRLTLRKASWQIAKVTAPVVISFAGGESFNIIGIADGEFIRADVADDQVKGLVHHFTADQAATVTLPNGQDAPWTLDLRGTTPTIEAMAECLGIAHLWLPPPFLQAPADGGAPAGTFVEETPAPPPAAAVASPAAAPVVPPPAAPATPLSAAAETKPASSAAPAAPEATASAPSCKDDWRACKDNDDLVNNYADYVDVRAACEIEGGKQARYGNPVWPGFWSGGSFQHFADGTDYVTTGVAVAVEPDAQFQNEFGAMVHSRVICKYNLKTKTVLSVDVLQR